jgi:ribosome-binding factor A
MRNVASYRMRRINEALKEIIGTALTRELKDPRIGFVTLTGVETARDLSHAKVFLSVYGKQAQKDATLEGLRAAGPYLQRLIGDELQLRRIPTLEFVYDATVDRGMRIQAILKSSGVEELGPEDEPVVTPAEEPAEAVAADTWASERADEEDE